MSKKLNLIIIASIFILPILLFYSFKTPSANVNSVSYAEAGTPKVYKFSTALCSDCKRLKTVMDPVKQEYKGKITFIDVNASSGDKNTQMLVSKYNVRVVPTLIFIDKNGKMVRKTEGSMPRSQLVRYLEEIK